MTREDKEKERTKRGRKSRRSRRRKTVNIETKGDLTGIK
jgi:hypothetical protein